MRIGIDAREFKKDIHTGLRTILGDFLKNVHRTEDYEFFFFCNQHTDLESLPTFGEKVVLQENNTLFWDQFQLPLALRKKKVDVFFSPYIKTPLWRICPYVNAMCDVIPLKYSRYSGFKAFLEKVYFFLYSFICGHRSVKVLTLSHDAKRKISKVFGIGPENLKVVYPSVKAEFITERTGSAEDQLLSRFGLNKPYFLYVGNFKPHKNLRNLISAFEILPQAVKDSHNLLLVGGSEKDTAEMEKLINTKGLSGRVISVANIKNDDARALMRNAKVFVFPSLAEGFGIPPVEAMASGVPVVSSNLAPMTEVLGDAAIFFDPYDPEDMSKTMLRLLEEKELREECIIRGNKRASLFNAKDMSSKMLDIIEDAGREKTLCISSEFPPVRGGIATHIFNLWSRLPSKEIAVLTSRPRGSDHGDYEDMDMTRKTYPLGADIFSRTVRAIMVIWHTLRQNSLRNIKRNHCAQVLSAGLAALIVKKIKGTPYVVYMYSADVLEFSKNLLTLFVMKKILAESKRVIAISNFTKSLITKHNLIPKDKVSVIIPGMDKDMFNPEKGDDGLRKKYGINGKRKMILSVSRLAARKGHKNVVNAFSEVLKSYPDVTYVIVGDGPMRSELERLVEEKDLENNVIFTGEIPLEKGVFFYNACDIFVLIPQYIKEKGDVEGFGIVFLEANACGKPVVAGRSGGVIEAVMDGETGLLVDPNDVGQIRDALLTLLEDENSAQELGAKGLLRIHEKFDWNDRAEELKEYI
ncbi:glycosyltransferase [Candidatus Omnitrophota bacterium]